MKLYHRFATLLFVLISAAAYAQVDENKWFVNIEPQVAFSVGEFQKKNGIQLGGHFAYENLIAARTRVIVQVGGGLLQGKSYDNDITGYSDKYPSIVLIQFRAGAKYFVTKAVFISGVAGIAQGISSGEKTSGFSFAPALGFEFGTIRLFDISLRYDNSTFKGSQLSTIGFSIGYHI